jgi:hypothetical protein
MTTDFAMHNLSTECFVLKLDGRVKSQHRRLMDAMRAGLRLKDEFPGHEIKVAPLRKPTLN